MDPREIPFVLDHKRRSRSQSRSPSGQRTIGRRRTRRTSTRQGSQVVRGRSGRKARKTHHGSRGPRFESTVQAARLTRTSSGRGVRSVRAGPADELRWPRAGAVRPSWPSLGSRTHSVRRKRLTGGEIGHAAFNVLFLGLLGWALVWFFTSEFFYIDQIVVTGNQRVSADVIREISGLEGFSVFWINSRRVAANIVQSLPPITSVQVRYGLFDGRRLAAAATLTIHEQGEQLIWQVAGQRYWVDDEGTLHPAYGAVEQVPSAAAVSGVDLVVNDIRPGLPERVDPKALVAARQLIRLLPEVQMIDYAPDTGLRLHHPRGWLVYLGTGSDMARKVNVLRALEVEFAGEDTIQPALIDLRFPDSPYYRLPADTEHPADDAEAGLSAGGG